MGTMKRTFPAFLAGVLVVGSLMVASDKMNLFGGAAADSSATVAAVSDTGAVSQNSGVVTASASLISDGSASLADIAQAAGSAVVKIETKVNTSVGAGRRGQLAPGQLQGGLQTSGLGSGFIMDSAGYIVTNEHVIDGADEIDVTVQGYNQPFKATVVKSWYEQDVAVLKITGTSAFPALELANESATPVGDWVEAIGNPYDLDYSVSVGVLSAKNRSFSIDDEQGTRNYEQLIQTDTAINPGNSGGPLLNTKGQVIGMNTAVSSEAQGIGFAIPASTIQSLLGTLKSELTVR